MSSRSTFDELATLSDDIPDSVWRTVAAAGAAVVGLLAFASLDPIVAVGALALFVLAATLVSAVEIVDAYEKRALTVFGEYRSLLEPGLHLVPPFVSRTYGFDVRTRVIDVAPQEAITRDNSPVTADAVVYYRIVDAKKAFLEVDNYETAISNLAQTTLRAVIGDLELDDTLSRRDEINSRIRRDLDEPTDEWGISVEAVEVREVSPATGVKNAMEEQSSAERRRRAMILEAQGERRSAVETAEGDKQADIIRSQGDKQSQILEAQGDAVSTVLRAKSAESMGERAIIERGMESLERIGQGDSSTFIIPQELTSLVGRYGGHLSGSDSQPAAAALESREFDEETRSLLGLDNIDELLANLTEIDHSNIDAEVDDSDEERDLEPDVEMG
ncbi:SPFH domain-containing protein [Halonotius pteroides]|jgi:regulator of protease activity HflC (stomatin/prohibitin superfamily)|uniref:Phosphoesterase n=1 Tax=Halonotius pteroides TaxID=268735 RepID=A0A3A6QBI1_9EURY|nr:SPFH domain-containing protein [Halonotius pteroides]RJX48088.1 phosphoesterase [Halonotius pteroides]